MFLMKDNKISPAQAKVSQSPSYTLAEWKSQVFDYCNEWERETESTQTEFRLMLSLMFESLAKKEREANVDQEN